MESLLAAQAGAASFLNDSTGSGAGNGDDDDPQRTGERIGLFTLLERIATGGMGAVYRAERAGGDFTQQVAVKLIAAPMGDPDTARRFRAERQILAALHHPHIVALLDGGITPRAEALSRHGIRRRRADLDVLPSGARCPCARGLELFRQVCGAVQYLHQNFVVHRDFKPTNILITRDGAPKVLDFGIAKLVEPSPGRRPRL